MRLPWLAIAALLGASAVILGALGAHFTEPQDGAERFYMLALMFHMFHIVPLLALGFFARDYALSGTLSQISGLLFCGGIFLFCGSLYVTAFTGDSVGFYTMPAGGMSFVFGWLVLAVASFLEWRRTSSL